MKIYHFGKDTAEYVGSSMADESPREPGVFLIPANATAVEPPEIPANHKAIFNGTGWEIAVVAEPEEVPTLIETEEEIKQRKIASIKSQLIEIDQKRIRPLAEGEAEYLAMLNAQVVALREELRALL